MERHSFSLGDTPSEDSAPRLLQDLGRMCRFEEESDYQTSESFTERHVSCSLQDQDMSATSPDIVESLSASSNCNDEAQSEACDEEPLSAQEIIAQLEEILIAMQAASAQSSGEDCAQSDEPHGAHSHARSPTAIPQEENPLPVPEAASQTTVPSPESPPLQIDAACHANVSRNTAVPSPAVSQQADMSTQPDFPSLMACSTQTDSPSLVTSSTQTDLPSLLDSSTQTDIPEKEVTRGIVGHKASETDASPKTTTTPRVDISTQTGVPVQRNIPSPSNRILQKDLRQNENQSSQPDDLSSPVHSECPVHSQRTNSSPQAVFSPPATCPIHTTAPRPTDIPPGTNNSDVIACSQGLVRERRKGSNRRRAIYPQRRAFLRPWSAPLKGLHPSKPTHPRESALSSS